jgi:hypothetical protein
VSGVRLAPPRVVAGDLAVLESRARALARGDGPAEEAEVADRLVAFRLGGRPCAVSAGSVERAVSRLAAAIAVPIADGTERPVTWVEERPLAVADLAGAIAGAVRDASALAGGPAIVIATPDGGVAVAVEGPLELREDPLVAVAAAGEEDGGSLRPRVAGRLADGTSVIDPMWLVGWAARAARP